MFLDTIEDKISYWLNKYPYASLVVEGDFNIEMNNMLDKWPPRRSGSRNSVLSCLMDKFDLVDVWREQFPNDRQYTWSNKDCSRQSRIDYWLVSRCLMRNNISVNISNTPLTYHKAIYLSITLSSDQSSGPKASFWKRNSSLSEHDQVKQRVKELIANFWIKADSQKACGTNWELLKYELGKFLRRFGGDLAKNRRAVEDELDKSLSNEERCEYTK